MTPDIESLLRASLEDVGNAYEPSDTAAARERFMKRRRVRRFRVVLSGVAVTAAAVAGALLVFSVPATEETENGPLPPAAALAPEPIATIAVGDEPVSASASESGVWVAERGSSSVSLVDPRTERVRTTVPLDGQPDEVVATDNEVWIADVKGGITHLHGEPAGNGTYRSSWFRAVEGDDVHLDLAATPEGSMAVDPSNGDILWITGTRGTAPSVPSGSLATDGGWQATDVVADGEDLWLLDGDTAEVRRLTRFSGEPRSNGSYLINPPTEKGSPAIGGGRNADLAITDGSVWVATGEAGSLFVLDRDTLQIQAEIEVGGAYTDLASDGPTIWALTGPSTDGGHLLRQFDAVSGEMVGDPLVLDGRPSDLTFADGSVWVTDRDGNNVIRIRPVDG